MGVGADDFIATGEGAGIEKVEGCFDLILDLIPVYHDILPLQNLLNDTGKLVIIGVTPTWGALRVVEKMLGSKSSIVKSFIGGIRNTQEVIDLCAAANPQI